MRIAIAQINTTVGDFDGNLARILDAARRASSDADLVVYPELTISGYMPRDLLEERAFIARCEQTLGKLAAERGLPALVVGCPLPVDGPGKPLVNAAVLVRDGATTVVAKRLLPTYDVFDERRYFRGGTEDTVVEIAGTRVGITVCEDIWSANRRDYETDPVAGLKRAGAEVIVNLSASPYEAGKPQYRHGIVRRHGIATVLCNLVGANDQLIFDGNSFAVTADGALCAHAAAFAEDLVTTDFTNTAEVPLAPVEDALVLGIRDYFEKTGFSDALVGLSGGVDSSLTACLAVQALGAEHVTVVGMPGPFSADHSLADARELADSLGVRFHTIEIRESYELLCADLAPVWGDQPFGVAEENLQARIRGTLLMSLANRWNALVLVPSNKSELAMGYCTLYGDMVGALAPISDLYKTEVYEIARGFGIPTRVLERPPSAELRPNQTDQDTLPPYDVLDPILIHHIEERLTPDEIVAKGFEEETVHRILRAVSRSEYKRQQGAPMLKVKPTAFDLGRRYPIVERFRGGTP